MEKIYLICVKIEKTCFLVSFMGWIKRRITEAICSRLSASSTMRYFFLSFLSPLLLTSLISFFYLFSIFFLFVSLFAFFHINFDVYSVYSCEFVDFYRHNREDWCKQHFFSIAEISQWNRVHSDVIWGTFYCFLFSIYMLMLMLYTNRTNLHSKSKTVLSTATDTILLKELTLSKQ